MTFWQQLKEKTKQENRGIYVLAPMADVTDSAFRAIIAKYGKPDVTWTEFVSADGLFLGGYNALINDLRYSEAERPIVAQFFTSKPEMMEKAARLVVELGFDGIDINMGCPDKSIEKQGAGAGLIKNPTLAQEIIFAAQQGAEKHGVKIPVSVKTRIGYTTNEIDTWIPKLLSTKIDALTLHARTRKEMSLVPARWEHVAHAVRLRDELSPETVILGNGDVRDIAHAQKLCTETGADGAMLGRAIFGNPWLFSGHVPSVSEKLRVLVEHTFLFEKIVGPKPPVGCGKSFALMKKHYKAYVNGFDGAKELRVELMEAENAEKVGEIVESFLREAKNTAL
jgi:nifR3 family TIM-barrel protein